MAHACDLVGRGADGGAQALSWHQKYVTQTKKAPSPLLNVNWKSKGGFLKKGTMCLWWFRIPMRIFFQFLSIFLPYLMIFWSSALPSARFTSKNHPNITKKNIGKNRHSILLIPISLPKPVILVSCYNIHHYKITKSTLLFSDGGLNFCFRGWVCSRYSSQGEWTRAGGASSLCRPGPGRSSIDYLTSHERFANERDALEFSFSLPGSVRVHIRKVATSRLMHFVASYQFDDLASSAMFSQLLCLLNRYEFLDYVRT